MKRIWTAMLLSLLNTAGLYAQDGKQVYSTYCAGCHGAQLEGNTAAKLIKTEWIYGRGRGAIIRNITFGIHGTEMAAWNTVLSKEEIRAVTDYIIAAQETPPSAVRPVPEQITTEDYSLKIEKLVEEGISTPWGIEFVDEQYALFTERNGNIRWLVDGKLDPQPIQGLPPTQEMKTGGYMDIALDPAYAENGWVYFAFSHTPGDVADEKAPAMTKLVRGRIKDYQWMDEQTLFEVPDSLLVVEGNRWGCRLMFDREGFLYFTIGDMAQAMASQDAGKAPGKVYRIHPDGSIPEDNPYADDAGALKAVYTTGNRNVQGLAQHPVTGDIWATEHGPMGGDELNILKSTSITTKSEVMRSA